MCQNSLSLLCFNKETAVWLIFQDGIQKLELQSAKTMHPAILSSGCHQGDKPLLVLCIFLNIFFLIFFFGHHVHHLLWNSSSCLAKEIMLESKKKRKGCWLTVPGLLSVTPLKQEMFCKIIIFF